MRNLATRKHEQKPFQTRKPGFLELSTIMILDRNPYRRQTKDLADERLDNVLMLYLTEASFILDCYRGPRWMR